LRHFIIAYPDSDSELFLDSLLVDIEKSCAPIKQTDRHHFTILYLPNDPGLCYELLRYYKTARSNINIFSAHLQTLGLCGKYLIWEFKRSPSIENVHKILLENLDMKFHCGNREYSNWSPHMSAGYTMSTPDKESRIITLSPEIRHIIDIHPVCFNKVAFTRQLDEGKYETLYEWDLI